MQCGRVLVAVLVVLLAVALVVKKDTGLECEGDWIAGYPAEEASSPLEMQLTGRGRCVWTMGVGIVMWDEPFVTWQAEYSGVWMEGRMEGEGEFVSPSGCRYEGEWKRDRREGEGKFTLADGSSLEGMWQSDSLTCPHAVLVLPKDTRRPDTRAVVYMGPARDSLPHGAGELRVITPSGRISLQAQFDDGTVQSTGGWVDVGDSERLLILEWKESCLPFAACGGEATVLSPESQTHYFLSSASDEWVPKRSATSLKKSDDQFETLTDVNKRQASELEALNVLLASLRRFEAHFLQFQPQVRSAVYDFGNEFFESEQKRQREETEVETMSDTETETHRGTEADAETAEHGHANVRVQETIAAAA